MPDVYDPKLPIIYSSQEIDDALRQAGIPKSFIRLSPHESGKPNRWRMCVQWPESKP